MHPHPDPPMVVRSTNSSAVLRVNRTFKEQVGFTPDELSAHGLAEWVHPEDWPQLEELIGAGEGEMSARHRTRMGVWVGFDWQVKVCGQDTVVLGRQQATPGSSSRTRTTRSADAPRAETPAETLAETLRAMALIVEAKNPGLRCSILLVDEAAGRVTVGAGPSLPSAYNEAVEGLHIGPAVGSCGTAAYWNVPVVVEDIARDPLWRELREAARLADVAACWSQPIPATGGGVLGAMALYCDEPREPTQSQMDGLEIAARMVGLAIERDGLESRLRESAKMEAIGRLAGGVANDFNDHLTVILGRLEAMREASSFAPDSKTLDEIQDAVAQASQVTSQLLAFGRQQEQQPELVVLSHAVLDVMRTLGPLTGDAITVSVGSDASDGWVEIDRPQLGQILLNLVLNARDAMPEGGRLDVQTRAPTSQEVATVDADGHPGSYVAITVTDSGQGMDAATVDRIFEPFFTTKGGRGSGLGLATVYGLTRQHGGFVSVMSELDQGTTFTLLFPRQQIGQLGDKAGRQGDLSFASVLVVDDSAEVRDLVESLLAPGGFQVVQAPNGVEALRRIEEGLVVDLLIADVTMPQMGGVELSQRIRQLLPGVGVVYVSGSSFDRLSVPDFDPTRETCLAKPFTPAQLRKEVQRALTLTGTTGGHLSPSS